MDMKPTDFGTSFSSVPHDPFKKRLAIGLGTLIVLGLGVAIWFASSGGDEMTAPEQTTAAVTETAPEMPAEAAPKAIPTNDRTFFAYDEASLTAESRRELDQWAARMQQEAGLKLQIEGHCDERGSNRYNRRLGQRRADNAKAYLVQAGIEAGRINTVSYGEERPASKGHGESSWSENRRVEFKPVEALSRN